MDSLSLRKADPRTADRYDQPIPIGVNDRNKCQLGGTRRILDDLKCWVPLPMANQRLRVWVRHLEAHPTGLRCCSRRSRGMID